MNFKTNFKTVINDLFHIVPPQRRLPSRSSADRRATAIAVAAVREVLG